MFGLRCALPLEALGHRLRQVLRRSALREAVVRVALIPEEPAWRVGVPSIVVKAVEPPSAAQYRRGLKVAIVPTRKFEVGAIDPQGKFSARLGSVLAVMEAQLRGADEAIFLDTMTGSVTESTASNLGVIEDGTLWAAPGWLGLLPGVTWQAMVEVAVSLRVSVRERPLTRHEVYNADEVLLSSTIKEVIGVTRVDGRRIGTGRPGPTTRRLHRAFRALVQQELT
jgi:branched-chain amino acid aminotransferase